MSGAPGEAAVRALPGPQVSNYDHFGCSTARNKGPTVCTNRQTIRHDHLDTAVLGALRERLMDPEVFKSFADAFTAEWNQMQAASSLEQDVRAAEFRRVRDRIER